MPVVVGISVSVDCVSGELGGSVLHKLDSYIEPHPAAAFSEPINPLFLKSVTRTGMWDLAGKPLSSINQPPPPPLFKEPEGGRKVVSPLEPLIPIASILSGARGRAHEGGCVPSETRLREKPERLLCLADKT